MEGSVVYQAKASPFRGKVGQADVELAKNMVEARAEYEAWEHVTAMHVHGCEVRLHRKAVDNLFEYYAFGALPLSPDELVEVNWDTDYRLQWDEYAKSIRVFSTEQHEGLEQDLLQWEVKLPWPLANRDYVYCRHRAKHNDLHIMISKGSSHPSLPEVSGVVRVEHIRNLMVIAKDPASPDRLVFQLLYFDDLKGSIPTWAVNWAVSKAVPSFLNNLVDAAKKRRAAAATK